jgi:hypothetical protein
MAATEEDSPLVARGVHAEALHVRFSQQAPHAGHMARKLCTAEVGAIRGLAQQRRRV